MFNRGLTQAKAALDDKLFMAEALARTRRAFEEVRLMICNGISSFPIDAAKSVMLALSIILLMSISGRGQGKENNNWFFGNGAGLTFNTTTPTALPGGALTTIEGCASISDKNGNVLFYTDGTAVWNKNNKPMTGGTGLLGHTSATQSAIIVPWPGTQCQKYFIFTVDAAAHDLANGLRYSVVDFATDPLGAVGSTKNVLLKYPVAEKLTAVSDGSGGFWVIAHGYNIADSVAGNNDFYAYHVVVTGLQTPPVLSQIGSNHGGGSGLGPAAGYLKISPNGKLLACASWMGDFVEVFNFNAATGSVTAPVRKIGATEFPNSHPYGIEFSPDGSKLYVSTNRGIPNKLLQFDLLSKSVAVELASTTPDLPYYDFGALQLGPDGEIYLARSKATRLSVINLPNALGIACSYSKKGPFLPPGSNCELGLPCVIQGEFSCDPPIAPSPMDPCCPPWNKDLLKDTMFYEGRGSISAPYTLHFQPTTAFNNQMQAYINYLHSLNSAMNAITIDWRLSDQGNNATPNPPYGPQIGSTVWTTWNWNATGIGAPVFTNPGFFAKFPMHVNTWYMVHTGIYLENGQKFFPDKCAVNEIYVRIEVMGAKTNNGLVLEFSDGKKVIKTIPIQ